ncbi:hypothetical protein KIL84_010722 [Mauremys mutica]|uniref:Uncharacterized protein n=1 Tax=Mauremys mutica TaxID=74926 RepID=A0A9D3XDG9_9SAUR|nr:hypothetical protein KIL84_010722 [Mauremys mutica]
MGSQQVQTVGGNGGTHQGVPGCRSPGHHFLTRTPPPPSHVPGLDPPAPPSRTASQGWTPPQAASQGAPPRPARVHGAPQAEAEAEGGVVGWFIGALLGGAVA